MDPMVIKSQAVRFNRARSNLLAVVAFTVINLIALTLDFNFSFLFSALVPQFVLIVLEEVLGGAVGLVLALGCTAVYLVCYLLSKRWRVFILVALILFALDALVLFGLLFLTGAFGDLLFNILFHGWVLFYLITGTVAWVKLRRVTPDEIAAIQQSVNTEAEAEELDKALDVITPDSDREE